MMSTGEATIQILSLFIAGFARRFFLLAGNVARTCMVGGGRDVQRSVVTRVYRRLVCGGREAREAFGWITFVYVLFNHENK